MLLNLDDEAIGRKYAEVFFDEAKKENDRFHQLVIDAVYKKEQAQIPNYDYVIVNNVYLKSLEK